MSTFDNYHMEILNSIIVYIYRYGNPLIYILGIIGNLLSAIVFFQRSWNKNVCVFYFKVCLFLSFIYLNSTILGFAFLIGFNINLQNSSVILCKLFYYVPVVTSTLLPTVLILASIDRLLISSQNVNTSFYKSKSLAYISVSISTLFWLTLNSHILIKIGIYETNSSVYRCAYHLPEIHGDYVYYSLLVNDVIFWLIILILCVFSFKNVRRIRTVSHQLRNQIQSIRKKDFQLLRCLFVHDVIYVMAGVCSAVYSVYTGATRNKIRTSSEQALHHFLTDLFTFFGFISYSVSFFIFLTLSKAFRRQLKRLVYKMFGRNSRTKRKKENNVELNALVTTTIVSRN